jgi:hypothetical protein
MTMTKPFCEACGSTESLRHRDGCEDFQLPVSPTTADPQAVADSWALCASMSGFAAALRAVAPASRPIALDAVQPRAGEARARD